MKPILAILEAILDVLETQQKYAPYVETRVSLGLAREILDEEVAASKANQTAEDDELPDDVA